MFTAVIVAKRQRAALRVLDAVVASPYTKGLTTERISDLTPLTDLPAFRQAGPTLPTRGWCSSEPAGHVCGSMRLYRCSATTIEEVVE
jgi:hypothetical protein